MADRYDAPMHNPLAPSSRPQLVLAARWTERLLSAYREWRCRRPLRALFHAIDLDAHDIDFDPPLSIDIGSIPLWDLWAIECGPQSTYWTPTSTGLGASFFDNDDIAQLVRQAYIPATALNIRDVTVCVSSKAPLWKYQSFDEMIRREYPKLLNASPDTAIPTYLDHCKDFSLWAKLWDPHGGRVAYSHQDGSHHFAAARYLAKDATEPVILTRPLSVSYFSEAAVQGLLDHFDLFAIPQSVFGTAFFDCMQQIRCPHRILYLPRPLDAQGLAILFPRTNPVAMHVARQFDLHGALDLGRHLLSLLDRQRNHPLFRSVLDPKAFPVATNTLSTDNSRDSVEA